jgi:hypothetical protein
VRENRTQGSVRGRSGNWLVYLDSVKKISGEIMTAKKQYPQKLRLKQPSKKKK